MYSENTQRLMNILQTGKGNAVKRKNLTALLGANDRTARHMIEDARREGVVICNDYDGAGYYIPTELNELVGQFRRSRAMANAINAQMGAIKRAIESIDQMTLYEVMKECQR